MVLYFIFTYLLTLGFIIEGEDLKNFKSVWLVYALLGPLSTPLLLGMFISMMSDYIRLSSKKL